ncbi:unnamed protein product [Moneuplotes crassus]|uniref:Methyltransferase type 11 domain-containing protein n=1 Tax=Euplotes crassus TaxID=5936 RepID=A0AAD2D0T5_EUPCR|nr:unnamed protein product [Moneuplotes crassus]
METKEVDHERMRFLRDKFNVWAPMYETTVEKVSIQSSFNLYSVTRANKGSKICEVGAGCGLSARLFISYLMKDDSSYFVSDISDEMNKIFVQRFLDTDTALDPNVKIESLEESESIDVDKEISRFSDRFSKRIFSLRANNEFLPFPDGCFDVYISTLSLMIVPNPENQLSEAYRVLEEGGIAGFSVWGRKENCTMMTFVGEVFKEAQLDYTSGSGSSFKLSDKDALVKDVKKVGFKDVKAYYTMTNPGFASVEESYNYAITAADAKLSYESCTEEQKQHFKTTFYNMYEERYGDSTSEMMNWETLVVVAKK